MSIRRAVPLLLAAACTGPAAPPSPPVARSTAAAPAPARSTAAAPARATPPPTLPTLDRAPQSARVRPRPAPCLAGDGGATPT
ncbi:MAG TPA: hypothetical protein VD838_08195, partial [Anaeromyxobacteraceae bacterium]|nr:hypothetical protein [Anaeromyxobacteraceae bacterium]